MNFNPRSHKRSDDRPSYPKCWDRYFNPRSHKRSDSAIICLITGNNHFNPRSHKRSDSTLHSRKKEIEQFQSTLPQEERRARSPPALRLSDFNPRSHKRSDLAFRHVGCQPGISIHAPTRGATYRLCFLRPPQTYFNPRSHKRSDASAAAASSYPFYFNPRSHKRSDLRMRSM